MANECETESGEMKSYVALRKERGEWCLRAAAGEMRREAGGCSSRGEALTTALSWIAEVRGGYWAPGYKNRPRAVLVDWDAKEVCSNV